MVPGQDHTLATGSPIKLGNVIERCSELSTNMVDATAKLKAEKGVVNKFYSDLKLSITNFSDLSTATSVVWKVKDFKTVCDAADHNNPLCAGFYDGNYHQSATASKITEI